MEHIENPMISNAAEATDYREEMIEKLEADIRVLTDANLGMADRLAEIEEHRAAMQEHRKKCMLLFANVVLSLLKLLKEMRELDDA